MAKKPAVRIKRSVVASSSKTGKASATKKAQSSNRKKVVAPPSKKSKASGKAKSSSRASYKQAYIKLLEKTNKTLTRDVKAIRKAIEHPEYKAATQEAFPREAFPKEPSPVQPTPTTTAPAIEQQILEQLRDIELQLRSRDTLFEDLVSGSPKLGGFNG